MTNKKEQSGRSMVEMLGVLAIIGLISIGGITSMGYVDSYFRVNATLLEVDNLAADIADTYSWDTSYTTINLNELCSEKAIDDCSASQSGETTTYTLENRWGGEISIEGEETTFKIKYKNVPLVACQQIVDSGKTSKSFHYVDLISPQDADNCTDSSELVFQLR